MKVKFSARARADFRSIGLFIASDNRARARTFVLELQAACRNLADNPERFAKVADRNAGAIRRMPHRGYSIFYLVKDKQVFILRVVHGAMVTGKFVDDLT